MIAWVNLCKSLLAFTATWVACHTVLFLTLLNVMALCVMRYDAVPIPDGGGASGGVSGGGGWWMLWAVEAGVVALSACVAVLCFRYHQRQEQDGWGLRFRGSFRGRGLVFVSVLLAGELVTQMLLLCLCAIWPFVLAGWSFSLAVLLPVVAAAWAAWIAVRRPLGPKGAQNGLGV